jgi:hypothetical protein
MVMPIRVKLDNITEGMEFQTDESTSYLNEKTGEVVTIDDEEFRYAESDKPIEDFLWWEQENIRTAKKILESDDYIPLPSKFDIHEYNIMKRFCLSITDDQIRDRIYRSIKGSGAFRRFKENIRRYNLEEDWYECRDKAIKQIAIDWCKENGIEFIEN